MLSTLVLPVGCEEAQEGLDASEIRAEERDARCDFLVRCGYMPDRDACRAAEGADPALTQAVGAIALGRVEYDPVAAQEYVALLRELACDGTLEVLNGLVDARREVFEGTIANGDPCWATEECRGDSVCDLLACEGAGQLCCHGTCRGFQTLSVGDPCPLDSDEAAFAGCSPSAFCNPPPDDGSGEPPTMGTCAPRSDNGMPCEAIDGCGDGQRCNVGDSNLCYFLSGSGEQCNPNLGNGSCIEVNQICDPGTSTCVDAPAAGAPCVQGRCIGHAVCQEDICVARLRENDPCDGNISCLGDLNCQDGFCQRSRVSLVCVSGDPPPPPDPGMP